MRKHPAHGRDVIAARRAATSARQTMRSSRWPRTSSTRTTRSGTARAIPQGLRGASIPIVGRLMALVDVYDALTTRRVYREPMSPRATPWRSSSPGSGTHFDPAVVDAFLEIRGRSGAFWRSPARPSDNEAGIVLD